MLITRTNCLTFEVCVKRLHNLDHLLVVEEAQVTAGTAAAIISGEDLIPMVELALIEESWSQSVEVALAHVKLTVWSS